MTNLRSVCSHGHKLQFGDVQQAFNTGDPINRGQPLFIRMPHDGVPGEPRVSVQLLKTVNGLAEGAREWRNCFLLAAKGLGFETSVLEVHNRDTMVSLEWPSTTLLLGETKSGNRPSRSLRNVSPSDTGTWKRENSAVELSHKHLMDPCASDSPPTSRVWTLYSSRN